METSALDVALEVFDRGTWRDVLVPMEFAAALDAYHEDASERDQRETVYCGHWLVFVYVLEDFLEQRKESVPIAFIAEIMGLRMKVHGEADDVWIMKDTLVRDFISLVQLFALLNSADVEAMERDNTQRKPRR